MLDLTLRVLMLRSFKPVLIIVLIRTLSYNFSVLVLLKFLFNELHTTLIYSRQLGVHLAFNLEAALLLTPLCRLFLMQLLGSLIQLEVQVVDRSTELVSIETFGAGQRLEVATTNFLGQFAQL